MAVRSLRFLFDAHRVLAPFLACLLFASIAGASQPTAAGGLAAQLDKLFARPDLQGTAVGVRVVELPSGREVYCRDPRRGLIPASNMKLVTAAAALATLGDQYRFRTVLGFQGPDLVVVGGGDPALDAAFGNGDATWVMRQWARRLRRVGAGRIAGDLLLDDSYFDRDFVHPAWPKRQLYRDYCAPVGALSFNDNCVDVKVTKAPRSGEKAKIEILPAGNTMRTSGAIGTVSEQKKHVWTLDRSLQSDVIRFGGRFWIGAEPGEARVSVDDPTRVFGGVLGNVLREEGIQFGGRIRRVEGTDTKRISRRIEHHTPLVPVLEHMNKQSQNFYAEQVLKTMGASWSGTGSWDTGRQSVRHFLETVGFDPDEVVIDDGSGLSRNNRLSAWHLTELLRVMDQSPYRHALRTSLPVVGVDGTLKRRLTAEAYRGHVQAKTGTLRGVRALSGYLQTRDGRELAFSFLANHTRGRVMDAQNEFCRILIDAENP